jgi:hypothetical protein
MATAAGVRRRGRLAGGDQPRNVVSKIIYLRQRYQPGGKGAIRRFTKGASGE